MQVLLESGGIIFIALLGFSGCIGLVALVSPSAFATLASYGNKSFCAGPEFTLDRHWDDIDRFVLAHSRLFGMAVVSTVAYLGMVSWIGHQSQSNSILLLVVTIATNMGIAALWHMRYQSREIEVRRSEAHVDPLTGLTNRRLFEIELSRRMAQLQRQSVPLCLLVIDIDNFKSINDEFGHPRGDAILKSIASILEKTARQMDIVARYGGDEFAVLLPGSNLTAACGAAERLRRTVGDNPIEIEGRKHSVTLSVGLTEADLDDDSSSLFKRADSALYAAKQSGRNRSFRYGIPEPVAAQAP